MKQKRERIWAERYKKSKTTMAVTTSGWRISPAPPFPSLSSPTQNLTYKPINIVVRRVSASITLSSSTKSKSKSKPKRACLFAVSELVEDTSETHPQSEPTVCNIHNPTCFAHFYWKQESLWYAHRMYAQMFLKKEIYIFSYGLKHRDAIFYGY